MQRDFVCCWQAMTFVKCRLISVPHPRLPCSSRPRCGFTVEQLGKDSEAQSWKKPSRLTEMKHWVYSSFLWCHYRQAGVKRPQWVWESSDDVAGRQASWKGVRVRERQWGRPKTTPSLKYSQPRLTWIHILNGHLMISRSRLCVVLSRLCALPENHNFVWKKCC